MGPPGGARNAVDPRFISLYNVFNIEFPSFENLEAIYGAILLHHIQQFGADIKEACQQLTPLTLDLYSYIVEKLPPTPSRFHYIFNLRDLSRIFEVGKEHLGLILFRFSWAPFCGPADLV